MNTDGEPLPWSAAKPPSPRRTHALLVVLIMGLLLVVGVVIVVAGRGPTPAPARAAAPIAPLWTPPPDPMAQMRAILDASG